MHHRFMSHRRSISRSFTSTHVEALDRRSLLAATPIAINNPGFENPVLGDGGFTNNSISGWTGSDPGAGYNFGVFNVPVSYFASQAPAGQNVAYIERGEVFQTLTARSAVGKYVLSAKIGNSLVDPASPYRMELRAGNAVLGQVSSPLPATGTFSNVSLTVNLNAGDSRLNQPLQIRFIEIGTDKRTELYMDDVRLVFEPPSTGPFAVLSGGVLTVNGTTGNDYIRASIASNVLTVRMNNLAPLTFANASAISRVIVNGNNGNDLIAMASSMNRPTSLNGGDGNDTIIAGAGVDVINGGNGTDFAIRNGTDTTSLVEEVIA
jgi:Ca2+-binding RTX toxin-like protein